MSSGSKDSTEDVRVSVPHLQQKHSWDCGLACVQMILQYFGKTFESNFAEVCSTLKFGQSVWTIDVASILHFYGISFRYTTITLGVDTGYSNKSFYKDKFTSDEQRVTDLFKSAKTAGICIEQCSVSLDDIVVHLEKYSVVICLVDWNYLFCNWCDIKCLPNLSCVGRCLNSFQGHYIVLCGVNRRERLIYYKNPSYNKELCCCSWSALERARKSYGTDEDLIFIDQKLEKKAGKEQVVPETDGGELDTSSGRV